MKYDDSWYYTKQIEPILECADIKIKISGFPSYEIGAHLRKETNYLNISKMQLQAILEILTKEKSE